MFVKNHRPTGEKLLSGEIVKSTEPVSFTVRMSDGTNIRSHQDHLRKCAIVTEEQTDPPTGQEVKTGAEFEPEMDGMNEIGTSGANTATLPEFAGALAANTNPPTTPPELPCVPPSGCVRNCRCG